MCQNRTIAAFHASLGSGCQHLLATKPFAPNNAYSSGDGKEDTMLRRHLLACTALGLASAWLRPFPAAAETFALTHSDAEWHKLLTSEQYAVLRHSGTEPPGSSPLLDEHRAGIFGCAGCGRDCFPRRRNSTAIPAGRAFGRRSTAQSAKPAIPAFSWCEQQCTAGAAAAISAMSSTTARNRRGCAIA
jgi:SelR domain